MNIFQLERKLINKICGLSSRVLLLLLIVFVVMFFRFLTFTVGEKIESLTKVNGILENVQCISKISGSDIVYLKTSLSKEPIIFSGYKKCEALKLFKENQVKYDVLFYLNHSPKNEEKIRFLVIYAVDYNGRAFIHPENGLGEEEIFNFYSLFFLACAFGICRILQSRWQGRESKHVNQ